jgi:hypothetical protein
MEPQRGNVLFLILIAVALFAALSYAVTQSTNSGGANTSKEQAKLDRAELENYMAALQTGIMRLTIVRGCDTVDFTPPAEWVAGKKSCHLFHPDGAGVNYRDFGFDFCPDGTPLTDLNIGNSCGGLVYIGESGGNRIYAASTDNGSIKWKIENTTTPGTDTSDGLSNTDILVADAVEHPAANSCRSLGTKWYLPAKDELNLFWTNSTSQGGDLDLASIGIDTSGIFYWSSSEHDTMGHRVWRRRFNDDYRNTGHKTYSGCQVRCVRKD